VSAAAAVVGSLEAGDVMAMAEAFLLPLLLLFL